MVTVVTSICLIFFLSINPVISLYPSSSGPNIYNKSKRTLFQLQAANDPVPKSIRNTQLIKQSVRFSTLSFIALGGFIVYQSIRDDKIKYDLTAKLFKNNLKSGMKVLEVGYGKGVNTEFYPSDISLIGLDPLITPNSTSTADSSSSSSSSTVSVSSPRTNKPFKIQTVQGVCENLPFPDASFDAVVSTMMFCSVTNPTLCLQEITRVLKPCGVFICIEHIVADEDNVDVSAVTTDNFSSDNTNNESESNDYEKCIINLQQQVQSADIDSLLLSTIDSNKSIEPPFSTRTIISNNNDIVPKDAFLSNQQKLLDPLQVVVANGCHLNRHTDQLLINSTQQQQQHPSTKTKPTTTGSILQTTASTSAVVNEGTDMPPPLFSSLLSLHYQDFKSQWPITRQIFAALKK